MIVPKHYENLSVLHENTMPDRAYYVPASTMMSGLTEAREQSDRFQLLNGAWRFRYYSSIYDLQEAFYEEGYSAEGYDTLPVPSVWQMYGYDSHQYTNLKYPFPFDPPYVPQENPCGAYIHDFSYEQDKNAPRVYLNFEGVDSCFYVWINGKYVGYSQVSHSVSEFDVTDILREGNNRLAVLVLKWCDGSYLEDQDKFRMSGIFRDVYLLKRPEKCVYDYFVKTEVVGRNAEVTIQMKFLNETVPVHICVYDREQKPVKTEVTWTSDEVAEYPQKASFLIESAHLWNAEEPYLYTIVMETEQEVVTDRIGVREVKVQDKKIYINGQSIKFHGVNRHDFDPVTGYVTSIDQMKKDLLMMKQHNFNAIRTSHYPNVPMFYQLCDQYGFYVIDEADNESHGTSELFDKYYDWELRKERWNEAIADNPEFIEPTLDRTKRLVHRDKNRPCVVVWSMGNECAYGCTFEEALKWTKEFDSTRLTHYESAYYHSNKRKYDFSNIDIFSRMYPSFEDMEQELGYMDKPYLLCEYCHAMGNGPGDLEDYFQMFETHETMCGGFVWEWCDHAIYKGQAENDKAIYYYGGDHGEIQHDGNFCMDGLVYPDRTSHTGLLEYKNVYRPVRAIHFSQETGELTFHNYLDFKDLKSYLSVEYEVNCDGYIAEKGKMKKEEFPTIKPHEEGKIKLSLSVPEKGKCFLKINYFLKEATELLPKGYLLGFDEILLKNQDGSNQYVNALQVQGATGKIVVEEDDRYLKVEGTTFFYVYSKLTGLWEQMQVEGKSLLKNPMELNIWRAPTDNDRNIKWEWMRARFHQTVTRAYDTTYEIEDDELRIYGTMSVSAVTFQRILDIRTTWIVKANGAMTMHMSVKKNPEFPELPRFGIRLFLPKDMRQITYYGMGPMESYVDKCKAASHGIFKDYVENMHEDYLKPQENGSHHDCDYVILQGDEQRLSVTSQQSFAFNASVYTQEELTRKQHSYELVPSENTVLCIDYAQTGIGSNSCGPKLQDKYKLKDAFEFEIQMFPNGELEP